MHKNTPEQMSACAVANVAANSMSRFHSSRCCHWHFVTEPKAEWSGRIGLLERTRLKPQTDAELDRRVSLESPSRQLGAANSTKHDKEAQSKAFSYATQLSVQCFINILIIFLLPTQLNCSCRLSKVKKEANMKAKSSIRYRSNYLLVLLYLIVILIENSRLHIIFAEVLDKVRTSPPDIIHRKSFTTASSTRPSIPTVNLDGRQDLNTTINTTTTFLNHTTKLALYEFDTTNNTLSKPFKFHQSDDQSLVLSTNSHERIHEEPTNSKRQYNKNRTKRMNEVVGIENRHRSGLEIKATRTENGNEKARQQDETNCDFQTGTNSKANLIITRPTQPNQVRFHHQMPTKKSAGHETTTTTGKYFALYQLI